MENRIRELLAELLQKYRELEAKIAGIAQLQSQVERMNATVEIHAEMTAVKAIESSLAKLRQQFESSGASYSESTRHLVEESKTVLAKLIHELKQHEDDARRERENLAPQIHNGVKAKKMHHAYSNNG